jgi:hypothetical protein
LSHTSLLKTKSKCIKLFSGEMTLSCIFILVGTRLTVT